MKLILFSVIFFSFHYSNSKTFEQMLDKPIHVEKRKLEPDPVNPTMARSVTCSQYPGFVVKVVDSGEKGAALSLLPASTEECKEEAQPNEFKIEDWSGYFIGAKKDYAFFSGEDSSLGGGMPFMVIRPRDHKSMFTDEAVDGKNGIEIKSALMGKKAIQLTYRRNFGSNCSVALDTKNCVAQISRRTRVPKNFTNKCLASYKKAAEALAKSRCKADAEKDCYQKTLRKIKEAGEVDSAFSYITYDVIAYIPSSADAVDLKDSDDIAARSEAAPFLQRKSDVLDCFLSQ